MGNPVRPPRGLSWLIPEPEREFVLGDLEESFGNRYRLQRTLELLRIGLALRFAHHGFLHTPRRRQGQMSLRADIRYATRQLRHNPGFTLIAVLTLALGIGATTAIYSVVHPVLLESLPYPTADRIVSLWERDNDGNESNTGYATFLDVRQMATSFAGVAATSYWQPIVQGTGDPERLNGQRVTRDFFSVLGVAPALGRDFTEAEEVRGQHHVTILSYGLWQRRFGGDPSIVGKPINLGGTPYLIVGVMPKRFEDVFSPIAQLWAPLAYDLSLPYSCRTCRHLRELGRLKPGVSPAAAERELQVISGRLASQYPTEYPAAGMFVVPLQTLTTRQIRPVLLALLGAVALVLLIACVNVATLLLGRAVQREAEFAVRGALGAGRWRVARELLAESVLLALLGGGLGIGLAWAGVQLIATLGNNAIPRLQAIGIDGGVLGFTAAISLLTGLGFGMVPVLATARPDLFSALRPGARTTRHRGRAITRAILVGGEIAMAAMLLVGAGLLLRSLEKLLAVSPGFDARQVLTMQVQITGARYDDDAAVVSFYERALDAVKAVPGVEEAGWISQLPLGGNFDRYGVQIEGRPLANPELAPAADRYAVLPGYLRAMRIPLIRGRSFTSEDDGRHPPVALINETFARLSWSGEDPIGRRIQVGGPDQAWCTIVGVVGDVHHTGLDQQPGPQVYFPEAQWQFADPAMDLAVRTRAGGEPAALARAVEAAIRSVDGSLPILNVAAMEDVVAATAKQRRFAMVLFQVFALVALLLAAGGIYGVLSSSVTERTREIGIRAALGASRGGLLGLVVRQGLLLTLAGLGLGTTGALALSGLLSKLLFGVAPQDPVTLIGVMLVLGGVALVACWIPAWRATRVSPLEALRGE
jgi:putative ABC transport system permease protein